MTLYHFVALAVIGMHGRHGKQGVNLRMWSVGTTDECDKTPECVG